MPNTLRFESHQPHADEVLRRDRRRELLGLDRYVFREAPVAFYSDHTVRDGKVDRCRTQIPRT